MPGSGVYSKGTRSKGVNKEFRKAGTARNVQLSKKDRTAAYHAKEAFMKEAMARHLAAAEASVAAATAEPSSSTGDAERGAAAAAATAAASMGIAAGATATNVVDASGTTVTYSERTSAADIEAKREKEKAHVTKLRSKVGTATGQFLPGQLKFEGSGAKKAGAAGKRKKQNEGGGGGGGEGDDGTGAKESKIGHLMRPLKGNEIDFACQVDTNVKLPAYARGKVTITKKRKKNKKKNAREARSG